MNEEKDLETVIKLEIALDRIFYPKGRMEIESNSYAIIQARVLRVMEDSTYKDSKIKLKGNCCGMQYGDAYRVSCKLVEHHEQYGDTYEIIYISKIIDISDKDKQREFLKNVINENLVDRLFDKYDDVLSLLENRDTESLCSIKGISTAKAMKILQQYEDSKDYSKVYLELGELGLTHAFIKKLVDFYNSPDTVIDIVRNDPYDLVRVDGIGFKKADEVAAKAGITQYDPKRIKGFFFHTLNEQGELGKSYLSYQELMKIMYDTLGYVPEEVVGKVAQTMVANKDVVVIGDKVALSKYYWLEKNIAKELKRLKLGRIEIVESEEESDEDHPSLNIHKEYIPNSEVTEYEWEKTINEVEEEQGFEFTDEQKNASKLPITEHVIGITGGGGVGKTTIANAICRMFKGRNIVACALSGKASVRITEATGLDANTIHRTLSWSNGTFYFNEDNKLLADLVVIDEATMINGTLFYSLLKAIPTGTTVIIMGDCQQLTPIGNCQVFADILESGVIAVAKLTKPHRQALRSGIIPTSIKIAHQEQIFDSAFIGNTVLGELQDMELDIYDGKTDTMNIDDMIIEHFKKEMDKFHNIMEVQICVPKKMNGKFSCYYINNLIQKVYNPVFGDDDNCIKISLSKKNEEPKEYTIRVGDKVINTANNYKCLNVDGIPTPVFNGNMGIIKEIDDDGIATIDFEGIGKILFDRKDCKNLELGYACTVHKCQGAGFQSTIMCMDSSSYIMNNAELLYTGITRAKKYCVLIGMKSAIIKAIRTKETKSKQTFLKEFLIDEFSNHPDATNEEVA